MKTRDMSERQFRAALARYGFTAAGFMGYYNLGIPGRRVHASILNAGDRRRDQLAYLLRARKQNV